MALDICCECELSLTNENKISAGRRNSLPDIEEGTRELQGEIWQGGADRSLSLSIIIL